MRGFYFANHGLLPPKPAIDWHALNQKLRDLISANEAIALFIAEVRA
jgi:hypothetical protein